MQLLKRWCHMITEAEIQHQTGSYGLYTVKIGANSHIFWLFWIINALLSAAWCSTPKWPVQRELYSEETVDRDHITPLLRDNLHWLRVRERITFKLCLLAYKAMNGPAPSYIDQFQAVPSGLQGDEWTCSIIYKRTMCASHNRRYIQYVYREP